MKRLLLVHGAYWLAWWFTAFVLWLLLVTITWQEVIVGIAAAAIAATAAEVTRANGRIRFRPRVRWLLRATVLPGRVLTETVLVTGVLWRRLAGGANPKSAFRAIPFPVRGDDAQSSARRALVTAGLSAAPNTVVIGIDPEQQTLLLHQLLPWDEDAAAEELRRSL